MKKRSHTIANCVAYVTLLCAVAYAWPWVLEVSPSLPGMGGSPAIGSLPPTVVVQEAAQAGSEERPHSRAAESAPGEAHSGADFSLPHEPALSPLPAVQSRPKPPLPVYPSGYVDGGKVLVDLPAADDSTALLLERQLATLSEGSCVDFGQWREVSPRNVIPDGTCARYRTLAEEEPGEVAVSVAENLVRRDDTPPPPAQITIAEESENAHADGETLFYREAAGEAGTFALAALAVDPESGVEQVTFPALGDTESRSQPGGDASLSYAWSSDAEGPTEGVVVVVNGAGSASEAPVRIVGDAAPPAAGFVSYAGALHRDGSVEVTVDDGNDAGSGVDNGSGILEQQDARLLGGGCRRDWSFWHPAAPDGSQEHAVCVRFRYRVSDNVGNEATYASSGVAKVVDQMRPTVAIVAPGSGETLHGAVRVATDAADIGFGVAAVRLEFGRAGECHRGWRVIATTTTAPYAATWETSLLAPGRYRVRAFVTDRAGNRSVSAAVVVLIPAPPAPPEDDEPRDDEDEPAEDDEEDDDAVAETAVDVDESPPPSPEQSEAQLPSEEAGSPAETAVAERPPDSPEDEPDITSP